MLSSVFSGIFTSTSTTSIEVYQFVLCMAVALILGTFLAFIYGRSNESSRSFLTTVAILPAIVCVVIMLVNGNIGAGVAVAGAFSLVRFRSAPGNGKEISTIFLAMGAGLICGMGYLGYAILFTLILAAVMMLLSKCSFGMKDPTLYKDLRITVPEDLNYTELFDDLMQQYTDSCHLNSVKTSNMGSLFKLRYRIALKDAKKEKEFMDALRTRNGNLEIVMSQPEGQLAGGDQL